MSNADFQTRLQRISANSPQQPPVSQGRSLAGNGAKKLNFAFLVVGAISLSLGRVILKYANESYETIRDSGGAGMAAGIGLVGAVVLMFGVYMIIRAVPRRSAESKHAVNADQSVRQTSNRAKTICSLLGLTLGGIAVLHLAMSAAAGQVETEKAQHVAMGGIIIALFLLLVSVLTGIAGLFLRGYALGRVPVYFLIGAGLTFAAVRFFRINMLEWQQFAVSLQ